MSATLTEYIPTANCCGRADSKKGHGGPGDSDFWAILIIITVFMLIIWGFVRMF